MAKELNGEISVCEFETLREKAWTPPLIPQVVYILPLLFFYKDSFEIR